MGPPGMENIWVRTPLVVPDVDLGAVDQWPPSDGVTVDLAAALHEDIASGTSRARINSCCDPAGAGLPVAAPTAVIGRPLSLLVSFDGCDT